MSVKPSRTTVISVAAATAVLVAGTAAAGIATSYRHVTVEVDGVTHDVSGFFIVRMASQPISFIILI